MRSRFPGGLPASLLDQDAAHRLGRRITGHPQAAGIRFGSFGMGKEIRFLSVLSLPTAEK
jgi:hypothetical protein